MLPGTTTKTMSTNKPLAVIGKVQSVAPIAGADFIQQVFVECGNHGTWSGVAGKDIEAGHLVTVLLQDAILPPSDRWAFMEKHNWRVRMARFKGVPSECLIVPGAPDIPPGTDLTEALGVTKYEKPIPAAMSGDAIGPFPGIISKTDEPNFQAVPEMVARMAESSWYATEKADGTSCTVWNDADGMHVCSRNWELREFTASGASNVYWRAARLYEMDKIPVGFALQFEIVGPGVQGNPMGLNELQARAFSLYDIPRHCYAPRHELQEIAADVGIPLARVVAEGDSAHGPDELRKMAEIKYPNGKHGEGIVIRAADSSWSFKVINLLYRD